MQNRISWWNSEEGKVYNNTYDYIIDYNIATENEVSLVTSINGCNIEALNSILYSRTGFRDLEQILDCVE